MSINLSPSLSKSEKSEKQLLLDTQDSINHASKAKACVEIALSSWAKAITRGKENENMLAKQDAREAYRNFCKCLVTTQEFMDRCANTFNKIDPKYFDLASQFTYTRVKVAAFKNLIKKYSQENSEQFTATS